jgi:hypothetical protein
MTNLSEAKAALHGEGIRVARNGFFRMPGADGYVVVEANYSGIVDFARELVEMLEHWTPGEHRHFEHIDSDANPPLVIMMKDDE